MSPQEQLQQLEPPPEVAALGTPEQAVLLTRQWGPIQSPLARFMSDGHRTAGCSLLALAVFFLLLGLLAARKRPPAGVLMVAYGSAIACACGGIGVLANRKPVSDTRLVHHAYGFFPEALAYFQEGLWKVIRWDEIVEYQGPWTGSQEASVKLEDGTQVTLLRGFWAGNGVLMEVERRTLVPIMERKQRALAAGKSVVFGPLTASPRGLSYSSNSLGSKLSRLLTQDLNSTDKVLAWDDIGRLEVVAPANAGGLVGGLQALHLRLRIAKRDVSRPVPLLWQRTQITGFWFDDRFLPIPNRLVLLAVLCAWRPAHVRADIVDLVSLYMPWNPAMEHRLSSVPAEA